MPRGAAPHITGLTIPELVLTYTGVKHMYEAWTQGDAPTGDRDSGIRSPCLGVQAPRWVSLGPQVYTRVHACTLALAAAQHPCAGFLPHPLP